MEGKSTSPEAGGCLLCLRGIQETEAAGASQRREIRRLGERGKGEGRETDGQSLE